MFNFNSFALQLNLRTENLLQKLPPTDSRQRIDTRLWEENKLQESNEQKDRLENNQRRRKKIIKEEIFKGKKIEDDEDYYTPVYFGRVVHPVTGEEIYDFLETNKHGSNYWKDRELGKWDHLPRVFEDDCKPFY
jgi:hypothetical protein